MTQKHTDLQTASQGLKQYLRVCSNSGLAPVRAIAARYEALPKAERMPLYLSEFGSHWAKPRAAAPTAPKGGNMSVITPEVLAALAEMGVEVPTVEAEVAPSGRNFKKGTRFSFEAQNGNVREHVITRVKDGRVYTDQGQDFSIEKALNGYAADRVTIL